MTHEQICHISEIRPTVRHKSRLACLILQKRTSTAHFQYSSCPILEKRTSATHVRRITCPIHQKRTTETRFCLCTCPILQNQTLTRHNDGLGQAVAAICPRSSAFARSSSSIRRACCLMMMLAVPTSMPSSPCALTGNMFHRPVGDAIEVAPHHERMLIPVDELRDDLAVAHVAAAGHGFDGRRFPTIHTPFDALVSDEIRRKSRFPGRLLVGDSPVK